MAEGDASARIIENATANSKANIFFFLNNLVSTTRRRHAVCKRFRLRM